MQATSENQFIQVQVSLETVVVDTVNYVGYVVRSGFNVGNYWMIKRFPATGKDLRFITFDRMREGERLADMPTDKEKSAEYQAVVAAMAYHKPSLVGYGERAIYPEDYKVK